MKQRPWRNLVVVFGLLAGMTGLATAGWPPSALAQAREPGTLYVKPGGTSATCSSWSDACELQAALEAAQSGDEIWVAAGTYLPDYDPGTGTHTGDRSDSFQLVSGVAIYGGFPSSGDPDFGDRDWSTYVTLLSGDIGTAEVDTDNSYHVVYSAGVTETAVLDGFTISGGYASGSAEPHWDGGGMYNDDSSPTVSNCTFSNNRADQDGGGMHNGNESNPRLTNVTFINNTASLDGGGMHNHPYSSPELTNVTFSGNTAGVDGGGMSNGDSNPMLTNVTFNGNTAGRYGGGLYNWNSNPTLTNCILWGNTATTAGNQLYNSSSTPAIAYSDVQGSCDTDPDNDCGDGNIDADPLFVDPDNNDFHLWYSSPCIDAGDNAAPGLPAYDFEGDDRILDGDADGEPRVDMGVDEVVYEAPPPVIYVDADAGPTRAQDGTSWAGALSDLQYGLAWAEAGVEIWVAEGTYTPTSGSDRTVSFELPKGVAVYGGFAGAEENRDERDWSQYETILSGDLAGNDHADPANNDENSYHVVTSTGVTETAVLDGFTLAGGNADGSWPHNYGGGMYNDNSSPKLANVTFVGNSADRYGGGMYNSKNSSMLSNVTFAGNSAERGGGMYNYSSTSTLTSVTFAGNSAGISGGGIYDSWGSPTLTNVTFVGNTADRYGGGMRNEGSSPALTNCTFAGNSADQGGGIYDSWGSPTLTNVTFEGNAANAGGGMYNSDEWEWPVVPTVSNSILWGNTPDQIVNDYLDPGSRTTIAYSDVQGSCDTDPDNDCGLGNIDADPLFVDAASGDLRLQLTSPAIDAGDNRAVPTEITTDLGGHLRFVDVPSVPDTGTKDPEDDRPLVDMGAYEAPSPLLYVDADAGTTRAQDGTAWSAAFTDLQDALTWAVSGVEIWVAAGTYTPTSGTDRTVSFELPKGVAVYGGFAGSEDSRDQRDWAAHVTVLSGDLAGDDGADPANNGENSYHVVTSSGVTETAVLNGFTVTGGNANSSTSPNYNGGGMYSDTSSPALSNVTFLSNSAENGGGMFSSYGHPTLTNVAFSSNTATSGGGMFNSYSYPTLTNVAFSNNTANIGGGMCNNGSNPTLTDCSFRGNEATHAGGGMYSVFSNPTLINCSIAGNLATKNGGGMLDEYSDSMLTNCILWGNNPDQIFTLTGTPTIAYSDVQGGCEAIEGNNCGDGNIDADPLFVDADTGDLRLRLSSPAIDAGDNSAVPPDITTDLGGHPRFVDVPSVPDTGTKDPDDDRSLVDMGAYEAQYFTLSVTKAGSGNGTITSDPSGIDCGSDCTEAFFQATVVTLTATAGTGSIFGGWSGACTGDGDCPLTMDSARVVTGTFTLEDTGYEVYLPLIVRGSP